MTPAAETGSRLITLLKDLHLPAFRESYAELAKTAEKESLSYSEYLLALSM